MAYTARQKLLCAIGSNKLSLPKNGVIESRPNTLDLLFYSHQCHTNCYSYKVNTSSAFMDNLLYLVRRNKQWPNSMKQRKTVSL